MPDSLSYEDLLQKYRDLQLRVTRFSSTEQELINTRDRLDHELELYKRLNRYNAQALKIEKDAGFFQLMAEAIVDIFEVEGGLVFIRLADQDWSLFQEGVFIEQTNLEKTICELTQWMGIQKGEQAISKSGSELEGVGVFEPFSSVVASHIQDAVLNVEFFLIGSISKERQWSYPLLEPRHIAIFNVFVQQFQALTSNRVRGKEIALQLSTIQASQKELKKLSLIATKSKSGVIITDTFGRIEWVNEAFSKISGYSLEQVVGHKPKDLLQGRETDEYSKELLKKALWNKQDIELTIVNHDVNGKPYYNQLEIISVFDDDGNHINFIALQKDITAEINSQQEILRMNSRFELITKQSKIGIWEFNATNENVVWNDLIYDIYGVNKEEGQDLRAIWKSIIYEDDRASIDQNHTDLFSGKIDVKQDEYRIIRKRDGQLRSLETLTIAERDSMGKLIRLVGTAQDVTEAGALRKERDASIAKMNELKLFYEGILNHSPGDIFVFDTNGFLMYCNTPSSELGAWWNPFVGISIFDDSFPFSERQRGVIGSIKSAMKDKLISRVEDRYINESGEDGYYLQSILPYFNAQDELEHIIISGVDITEQKRNQISVEAKNVELKKINSELDNFVYSISHDLRSPLLSFKGIISLVLGTPNLDTKAIEFLTMADVSVGRLDGTIQEILEYSRNSRLGLQLEEVLIRPLVQEIFEDLKFSNVSPMLWNIDIEGGEGVITDKARIKILLRNIIGNSVKYKRDGVVNEINLSMRRDAERIYFEIRDKGEGISPSSLKRVFEMFYRGTTSSQGTGLGLYICREIVNKLKGEISIQSELGKGTSVYFWIPNNRVE